MDRFCPVGKIKCEHYLNEQEQVSPYVWFSFCKAGKYSNIINSWDRCPCVPLQKPIEDKYEKAWKIARKKSHETVDFPEVRLLISNENFIKALKEAGL